MSRQLILIIEPDPSEGEAMADAVRDAGFDVALAADGAAGMRLFYSSHPDVVVAALEAPDVQDWDLIEQIRALADTPVIVTVGGPDVASLQKAFDLRVEGFLVKPFETKELTLRLNGIQERLAGRQGQDAWVYRHNGLLVNWRSCEVLVGGMPVNLTSTEFKLLTHLVERRGWVQSHDQILSAVWGPEYVGDRDRVKLYVWYLRQKIEQDPHSPHLIVTKRGLGYTFVG
jgi:DNA-binding response OmpR family regulator